MKKQIIDCSLPIDDPDHFRVIDVPKEEENVLLLLSAEVEERAQEPLQKSTEDRLKDIEQIVENLTKKG